MNDLNEQIYMQNPWWRDSSYLPREISWPKRRIFDKFFEDVFDVKMNASLTGLRRVGKSTLMRQTIGTLLKKKVKPRNILCFSFDNPVLPDDPHTLINIIDFILSKIIKKNINYINEKVYLFFDEIQVIPFWQGVIKQYYDLNQNVKFIVTGSSSLNIKQKSKESLAGRIVERVLMPLSFQEYVKLSGRDDIIEFLKFGQFPHILLEGDLNRKTEYLTEAVVRKVLDVDIPRLTGIRKMQDFERLFWSLIPNTGQVIEPTRFMTDLKFKKTTIFNYLRILEDSLLFNKILNLSGSFRSETRLIRKYYPGSSNFLTLAPDPISLGFFAETYVLSLLKSKFHSVFLFHERGNEIDFVIPEKKLAIEVKFQESIHPKDFSYLKKYCEQKKYTGLLVTKNKQTEIKEKNLDLVALEDFENWF